MSWISNRIITTGIMVGLGMTTAVWAQDVTPATTPTTPPKGRINTRREREADRIKAGAKDGSLTKVEAAKLRTEKARTNEEIAKDRADGKVTPKERTRINRDQNKLSRNIYKQRHDGQTR